LRIRQSLLKEAPAHESLRTTGPFALFLLQPTANHLTHCSLCDMKEEAGAKVKRENNLQRDRSFNDLQNMLFLVFSLAQVAKEQMTVLRRFDVHSLSV